MPHWINNNPRFGKQAVFLDASVYQDPNFEPSLADFGRLKSKGINIIAPPMFALLTLDSNNQIVPSDYAKLAKAVDLDILTWTIERSGRLIEDMKNGSGGTFYYSSILDAINNDGDMMETLDVLAKDVGVIGFFLTGPPPLLITPTAWVYNKTYKEFLELHRFINVSRRFIQQK